MGNTTQQLTPRVEFACSCQGSPVVGHREGSYFEIWLIRQRLVQIEIVDVEFNWNCACPARIIECNLGHRREIISKMEVHSRWYLSEFANPPANSCLRLERNEAFLQRNIVVLILNWWISVANFESTLLKISNLDPKPSGCIVHFCGMELFVHLEANTLSAFHFDKLVGSMQP